MWGCLATPHDTITASENIEKIPYFSLGLLANLEDRWMLVDAIFIILGTLDLVLYFEDPSSPLQDGVTPSKEE